MALRVLLADESSTIKKVMQLALQDFGVEVKSVQVGLDVLTVTKTFNPDIIFADVLLSKKSGYDVCKELKSDKDVKHIPVLLMWSGFMELDEARATASMANDRLEKPFDADILRALVKKYVPRTQSNPVSNYLSFPPMPEFREESQDADGAEVIAEIEEPEDFAQVPLHNQTPEPPPSDENWTHQNLKQIKPQPPSATAVSSGDPDIDKFLIPDSDLGPVRIDAQGEFEEVSFEAPVFEPALTPRVSNGAQKPLSATETVLLERVAREEAKAMIENICWKILPEITERIVREEITKLLRQAEKEI